MNARNALARKRLPAGVTRTWPGCRYRLWGNGPLDRLSGLFVQAAGDKARFALSIDQVAQLEAVDAGVKLGQSPVAETPGDPGEQC